MSSGQEFVFRLDEATNSTDLLVNNQFDALFSMRLLFHFSTCFEQPSVHHQENRIVSIHHVVYITLCRCLPGIPEDDLIEDRNMLECFLKCFKRF